MNRIFIALFVITLFSGCSTVYNAPKYNMSPDNVMTLKTIKTGDIKVLDFTNYGDFKNKCRGFHPIGLPNKVSYAKYISSALSDELKFAGLYDSDKNPRIQLTGKVNFIDFSTNKGDFGGEWDIDLMLISSNGQSMSVRNKHVYEAPFGGDAACRKTAEEYLVAVQKIINRVITSPNFKALIK